MTNAWHFKFQEVVASRIKFKLGCKLTATYSSSFPKAYPSLGQSAVPSTSPTPFVHKPSSAWKVSPPTHTHIHFYMSNPSPLYKA